ncbi:Integral membrane protein 2b [Dirofilaria immitis]|nr:Integral membrane protein 2b [Dirofilaria immitis]
MTVFTKVKKTPEAKKASRSKESATVFVDSTVYQRDETGTLARIRQYKKFHRRPTYYGWCGTSFIQRGRNEHMEESVEINPDENLTAIVDLLSNRCFIKNLDRTLVAAPTSLIDLIEKMEKGHYKNPAIVKRTYRITGRISDDDIELYNHQ